MELPAIPAYDVPTLMDYIAHDKKNGGTTISTIHVKEAGSCTIEKESLEDIRLRLEKGAL